MSNRESFVADSVKYPAWEEAMAFVGGVGLPVNSAVIGVTRPTPDYRIHRTAEDKWFVFEYVLRGAGEICLDGVWKRAEAGSTYLLTVGNDHDYRADPKNPWEKLWINFECAYMGALLSAYGIGQGVYAADTRPCFETLLSLSRSGRPYGEICFPIAECLHRIVDLAAASVRDELSDGSMIREALSAAVYKRCTLDDIARAVHMSKSNMIRVFKRAYGVTPYEYLLTLKIDAARLLLKSTGMTVKEIADRVCVTDEHYFSALFRRRTGFSPSEYRRR